MSAENIYAFYRTYFPVSNQILHFETKIEQIYPTLFKNQHIIVDFIHKHVNPQDL